MKKGTLQIPQNTLNILSRVDICDVDQGVQNHILVPLRNTDGKEDQDQKEDHEPLEPRSLVDDPVPELVNFYQVTLVLQLLEILLELLIFN